MDPLGLFVSSFFVSAFAGLAALLRSGQPLTRLGVASSLLNSGFLGLGLCLLWYSQLQQDPAMLLGLCILCGLGGMTTLELILMLLRKGGLTIRLGKDSVEIPEEREKKP